MIVSWNWLKDYVALDMPSDEVTRRLMMAGLNWESTDPVDDDLAIDLEVTSNRPDCLGHVGVAREIGVLFDRPLRRPDPQPKAGATAVGTLAQVAVECPKLCPRYTARVLRGVRVGDSPAWLVQRLKTLGLNAINNVVDITNYVLMECGQPLHAFDLRRLRGGRIVVREARAGERLEAIDHKTYALDPGMCVIADAEVPVALGGVMGGAATEVSAATTDLLIEAADFAPLSIRTTARKLSLHSPSSYRFERGVDPEGVDWASRRCCEMLLDLCGGELAAGVLDVGANQVGAAAPIGLRLARIPRVLGIDVPTDVVRRILAALGLRELNVSATSLEYAAPSWRRDLEREIDLIEEVARIHGYDKIPEDVGVPMAASFRTNDDRVLERVRGVMTAAGFDEALTTSVVRPEMSAACSPWTDAPPLVCSTPMLKGADQVRRSLIPSLLDVRRVNEAAANAEIELFETARAYLARPGQLPEEPWMLAFTTGGDFLRAKGVVETLVRTVNPDAVLTVAPANVSLLHRVRSCRLLLDGEVLAFVGEVAPEGLEQSGLRNSTTVAELNLDRLVRVARLIPRWTPPSPYPAIARDLNLIVEERIRWSELESVVRRAAGTTLESIRYRETYRDAQKDGAGRKRLLFSFELRSPERTLTSEEADAIRDRIVAACNESLGASLLA